MRMADLFSPAPREVRLAGVIATLPGLAAVVFGVAYLIDALVDTPTTKGGQSVYALGAYFVLLGLATSACGLGLLAGRTWARSPAVVIAVITGGIGLYMAGPSGQPLYGVPILLLGAAIMVLLFRAPSRAWALGEEDRGASDGS